MPTVARARMLAWLSGAASVTDGRSIDRARPVQRHFRLGARWWRLGRG